MSEFPISEEAVGAVAKAMYENERAGNPVMPEWENIIDDFTHPYWHLSARAGLAAFFTAEGWHVETMLGLDGEESRLTSPWKPVSGGGDE